MGEVRGGWMGLGEGARRLTSETFSGLHSELLIGKEPFITQEINKAVKRNGGIGLLILPLVSCSLSSPQCRRQKPIRHRGGWA